VLEVLEVLEVLREVDIFLFIVFNKQVMSKN